MRLEDAVCIAEELTRQLRPACVRCEVGGSVRRRKPVVKDLEIVFIPQIETRLVDMFNSEQAPATDTLVERMVEGGLLAWDLEVKRNGPLYKRLVHGASRVVVELFAARTDNWGLIWALRTGPGDFNHILVSHAWQGGAMPSDMRMEGGYLWRRGERLDTPDEERFFESLGLPCWRPEDRTAAKLTAFLAARSQRARADRRFRSLA